VTFTVPEGQPSITLVVWQFWGRAAGRPELKSSGRFYIEWLEAQYLGMSP